MTQLTFHEAEDRENTQRYPIDRLKSIEYKKNCDNLVFVMIIYAIIYITRTIREGNLLG